MQQMLDLLPAGVFRRDPAQRRMLVLRLPSAATISVARRVQGAETPLGSFALDRAGVTAARQAAGSHSANQVVLQLPPGQLLERSITLPLAAEANLDRVLGYEMDRVTPFSASELFWSWRLERRDRVQNKLHVRLSMVLRAGLTETLEMLQQADIAPAMLTAEAADGSPRWLPLQHDLAGSDGRRRAIKIAGWVCAGLAVAVIATPLALNERAIARADARIEALQPRMAEVDALRARLAANAGSASGLAAEAERIGDPLRTLAALTTILPDDTWLSALTLQARTLTFTGQSAHAAQLIATLSANPAFIDPAFASPVTRAEANGADQFSIRTKVGRAGVGL
jgi:general secretion pathway protein L